MAEVKKRDIDNLAAFEKAVEEGEEEVELNLTRKEASDITKLQTGNFYPVIFSQ